MNWEKLSAPKIHGGMGFKDLSAFNLSMLGKQGWKFITEPNSLVARIFKARYFPYGSYLKAEIGHNPSYVWRNIMHARFLVRGSARWSIGSGASISILNEPWLHNGEFISSDIPTRVRLLDKGVVCPIDCASCDSNHEDLKHVFFDCPFVVHVWNITGLWGSIQHALSSTVSVMDAIFSLLEQLSVELA